MLNHIKHKAISALVTDITCRCVKKNNLFLHFYFNVNYIAGRHNCLFTWIFVKLPFATSHFFNTELRQNMDWTCCFISNQPSFLQVKAVV